jgi:hypothetical protein
VLAVTAASSHGVGHHVGFWGQPAHEQCVTISIFSELLFDVHCQQAQDPLLGTLDQDPTPLNLLSRGCSTPCHPTCQLQLLLLPARGRGVLQWQVSKQEMKHKTSNLILQKAMASPT